MSEKLVQQSIKEHMIKLGFKCFKIPGGRFSRNWPDQLFLGQASMLGVVRISDYPVSIFVEVKRPGEKPKPAQIAKLNELRRAGHFAVWAYSIAGFEDFLVIIKSYLEENEASKRDKIKPYLFNEFDNDGRIQGIV